MTRFARLILGPFVTALFVACMSVEETSREYPIATGRYYMNLERPEYAKFYVDFDQNARTYLETQRNDSCAATLYEGTWFVYTNTDHPEPVLKKKVRRVAGSFDGLACQTLDSLRDAPGFSESYWIRNVQDSSFDTCDRTHAICFDRCTRKSENPGSSCYDYDSSRTLESYWTHWDRR